MHVHVHAHVQNAPEGAAGLLYSLSAQVAAALTKSGATLHAAEITVEIATQAEAGAGAGAGGAQAGQRPPWRQHGAPRSDGQQLGPRGGGQLATMGYDAGRAPGRAGVGKPMRGVVFSNDHSSDHRVKQGNDHAAWAGAPGNVGGGPSHMSTGGGWTTMANGKRLPPGIEPMVGDWECSCANWNWARRNTCNKCGASKPQR